MPNGQRALLQESPHVRARLIHRGGAGDRAVVLQRDSQRVQPVHLRATAQRGAAGQDVLPVVHERRASRHRGAQVLSSQVQEQLSRVVQREHCRRIQRFGTRGLLGGLAMQQPDKAEPLHGLRVDGRNRARGCQLGLSHSADASAGP